MKIIRLIAAFYCIIPSTTVISQPHYEWLHRFTIGWASCTSIAVDQAGYIYITGNYTDTLDFDPGADTTILPYEGNTDVHITKYDNEGNFIWAKSIGGTSIERSAAIKQEGGFLYITGEFLKTTDFNPDTVAADSLTSNGSLDVYLLKLDTTGNFIWARSFGGKDTDVGVEIDVSPSGDIYLTGTLQDTVDLDPGPGVDLHIKPSLGVSYFISKFDQNGNYVWGKTFGYKYTCKSEAIVYDALTDGIYITGTFNDTIDFDPDPVQTAIFIRKGGEDAFIQKLNSSGQLQWVQTFGSKYSDNGKAICIDKVSGDVYAAGQFCDTIDFNRDSVAVNNLIQTGFSGSPDVYILRLTSAGSFVWARSFGTDYSEYLRDIYYDPTGTGFVYTIGSFENTGDFDPGAGIDIHTSFGNDDAFVHKIRSSGNYMWTKTAGGSDIDGGMSIIGDQDGQIYSTGFFHSLTCHFDNTNLTHPGNGLTFASYINKIPSCEAFYILSPDSVPQSWIATNLSSGIAPLHYDWNWGDGGTSTGSSPTHYYSAPGNYAICLTVTDAVGCVATYCDSSTYISRGASLIITVSVVTPGVTAVDEQSNLADIMVYPNPANDVLNLHYPGLSDRNITVHLLNMKGQEISSINTLRSDRAQISVAGLPEGIYLLQVRAENRISTHKMVISR